MRVAVLTDRDVARVSGVTTTLKALLAHAPLDVRPHIYTFADEAVHRPGYTALRAWAAPIPFSGETRMYLPPWRPLKERLAAEGIGMIHLTTPGPAGLVARRLARELDVPLVGSYHPELGEYTARLSGSRRFGSLGQRYMRWVYAPCAQILVPSAATRTRLSADGWGEKRLIVWGRGVDPDAFSPGRRSASLRTSWRVSDARPAILYAGRLSREKGLNLLSQVGRLLDEYRMSHRFIICGDGPMQGELRAALRDAVFTGEVDHASMGDIMASADLFLSPSETDAAGTVVLEAQASGVPVIIADAGGPPESMVDGQTGFVCGAGSDRDFCCRVAELLVDTDRRRRMGVAARTYALRRGWASALVPVFACYREALRAAAARPATPAAIHEHEAHV